MVGEIWHKGALSGGTAVVRGNWTGTAGGQGPLRKAVDTFPTLFSPGLGPAPTVIGQ